jgi:hypothetical protein
MPTTAWARDWEYYFEYKTKVSLDRKQGLFLNLKEETRYKDGLNYYRKSFFGISKKKMNSDLEVALYYAFKRKRKNDWHKLHMFWPQVDYKMNFRYSILTSATKLERHCSQNTYKFREKIKFILPLNKKINFWVGDEGRIFSLFDNPYFGENEVLYGFNFKLFKDFNLEIYYDLRRIKNAGKWQNTNCLRTEFSFKF